MTATTITHGCAGSVCRVCHPGLSGAEAATRSQQHALSSAHGAEWSQRAAAWIKRRTVGEVFTADDITEAVGLPSGALVQNGNNAVGAVMAAAARAGLTIAIGWVESTRPTSHARPVRLWQRVADEGRLL